MWQWKINETAVVCGVGGPPEQQENARMAIRVGGSGGSGALGLRTSALVEACDLAYAFEKLLRKLGEQFPDLVDVSEGTDLGLVAVW